MAKKRGKSKKPRSLFFRDKDIVANKKKLKALSKKKKQVKEELANIAGMYNDVVEGLSTGKYDAFPLETIYDLCEFADGYKDDFKLPMIKLRFDLKEKYMAANEEIDKLSKEIRQSEIDVLIAKAECVQKKM